VADPLDVYLPVSVKAPGMARRAVRRLTSLLDEELQANLALLVSELVSNSVQHPRHRSGWLHLKTWVVGTAVRVSVGDSGTGFSPSVVVPEPADEGHRGLWLVDMLADNWGISVDDITWSWFEIHGPPGHAAQRPLGDFLDTITDWPLTSKDLAWSMATSLGPPHDVSPNRLSWATPRCVAAIFCPDHQPLPDGGRHRRGLIEDRHGRWWLETLRNHQPHALTRNGA
jgi:anti-sigma regulatory factor (Ser/Thr protein kinase)